MAAFLCIMLRIFSRVSFIVCVGLVFIVTVCAIVFPDAQRALMSYRFYYVLTNSMEPTIETNSLVLVKTYAEDMRLEKDDIITFLANRFGEEIIIMHRFSHTEINAEGETVYKTRPEGSDMLDIYETKQDDILGVYLFHIPYAGKFMLFFRSAFGLLWLCEMIVILLVKALVLAKWNEKSMAFSDGLT